MREPHRLDDREMPCRPPWLCTTPYLQLPSGLCLTFLFLGLLLQVYSFSLFQCSPYMEILYHVNSSVEIQGNVDQSRVSIWNSQVKTTTTTKHKTKAKTPQKADSLGHYSLNKCHFCGYCQSPLTVYNREILFPLNMYLKDAQYHPKTSLVQFKDHKF